MPRRFRRRRVRRRPRRRLARIPRSLAPSKKVIRCNMVDSVSPSYAAGALACYFVQGNSVDDPLMTNSNQQPLGYDQWKAFYKKAKVLGCKVTVTCHNGSTGALVFGITPVSRNQGTTALTDFEHYIEAPGTRHLMLSPDVDKGTLVSRRSTKAMLKFSNMKDADTAEIDLITETPPVDNYYFHLWSQPFDKTTALTSVQYIVKIEYIVLLYDYIIPSRSTET